MMVLVKTHRKPQDGRCFLSILRDLMRNSGGLQGFLSRQGKRRCSGECKRRVAAGSVHVSGDAYIQFSRFENVRVFQKMTGSLLGLPCRTHFLRCGNGMFLKLQLAALDTGQRMMQEKHHHLPF